LDWRKAIAEFGLRIAEFGMNKQVFNPNSAIKTVE